MDITITQEALEFMCTLAYSDFYICTDIIIPGLILKGIRRIDKKILERKLYHDEDKFKKDNGT